MAAGLQSQAGAATEFGDPASLKVLVAVADQNQQPVTGAAGLEVRFSMALQIEPNPPIEDADMRETTAVPLVTLLASTSTRSPAARSLCER